jgi:hypothetical protein
MSYTKIENGKRVWSDVLSVRSSYDLALREPSNRPTNYFNIVLKSALIECGFEQSEKNENIHLLGKPIFRSMVGEGRVEVKTFNNLYGYSYIQVMSRHGVEEVKDISELFNLIRSHWK